MQWSPVTGVITRIMTPEIVSNQRAEWHCGDGAAIGKKSIQMAVGRWWCPLLVNKISRRIDGHLSIVVLILKIPDMVPNPLVKWQGGSGAVVGRFSIWAAVGWRWYPRLVTEIIHLLYGRSSIAVLLLKRLNMVPNPLIEWHGCSGAAVIIFYVPAFIC